MSSKILVDELAGNTAAGNITVTSEGGSATMQLQQGVAKSWAWINGSSGTPTAEDSFNLSSVTDNSTGRYGPVMTNPMNNTQYRQMALSNNQTGNTWATGSVGCGINNAITTSTTTYEISCYSGSYQDSKYVFTDVLGDLA